MEANLPDCPNIQVPRDILAAVVRVESAKNPFAIGVVGNRLSRQPKNLDEAVATGKSL
jgi:type IV secretion system protein VirB1